MLDVTDLITEYKSDHIFLIHVLGRELLNIAERWYHFVTYLAIVVLQFSENILDWLTSIIVESRKQIVK